MRTPVRYAALRVLPIIGYMHDDTQRRWLGRFMIRSMTLRESMPLWLAAQRASTAYPYARALAPERAAEQDMTIPMWPAQRGADR